MNSIAYFEIQASQPEILVRFYRDVFGWRITRDANIHIEYWRIETDGIRGAIVQRPAAVPPPQSGTNAYVCPIEVKNFDQVAERL